MSVTVGAGVSVLSGAAGVGVNASSRTGDNAEHPPRNIPNRRIGMSFFMEEPLCISGKSSIIMD
jgi:hypothetical protein